MYMPGVSRPFVGLSSDLISFRIAAYIPNSSMQAAAMETGLTGFNGASRARVRDGRTCDPRERIQGSYVATTVACYVHVQRILEPRVYACARGRESLENASALNRRASNRTRRGVRQPADTIVTGCINPPSWYPQGRASNPKVNALNSHRPPSASSSYFVVDFFFWTFPPAPLFATYISFFLASIVARYRVSSRSRLRVRWRISSGHERDVIAINLADTALARVGRASSSFSSFSSLSLPPFFAPPLLSLSLSLSLSLFRSFFTFCFFFYSFDLTTSASRTEW